MQIQDQFGTILVTVPGFLGQHLVDDQVKSLRNIGVMLACRGKLTLFFGLDQGNRRIALER